MFPSKYIKCTERLKRNSFPHLNVHLPNSAIYWSRHVFHFYFYLYTIVLYKTDSKTHRVFSEVVQLYVGLLVNWQQWICLFWIVLGCSFCSVLTMKTILSKLFFLAYSSIFTTNIKIFLSESEILPLRISWLWNKRWLIHINLLVSLVVSVYLSCKRVFWLNRVCSRFKVIR